MIFPLLSGLSAGLSLIVAIGAQNAFVLRQGLLRSHVPMVVAVCAVSDLALIVVGVGGVGALIDRAPAAVVVIRWVGAAFLLAYGLLAARRAVRGEQMGQAGTGKSGSWATVLGTCLAFTWLNPHVYLDTVLLLGSLAGTHGDTGRWWFAAGAGIGSIAWFSALGAGARYLTPLFQRRNAWRVLDAGIAVVMIALAALLLT
ncbi:LysE/ArgO family amino acid transporter [Arthrobacter sp. 92]|uniref:LysE/ArgO family amino acid transporter n=1 Tax=Arthrobacter sp. 92 TaxID=3418175 RepID=UPI003CFECAAD